MKATEFVKQYGLIRSSEILSIAPEGAASFDFINFKFSVGVRLVGKKHIGLEHLKRLVESYEIVELFGGAEQCKEDLNRLIANNVFEFEHRFVDNIKCTTERFKQAIADVEACQ